MAGIWPIGILYVRHPGRQRRASTFAITLIPLGLASK